MADPSAVSAPHRPDRDARRATPPLALRFMLAASVVVPLLFLAGSAWQDYRRLTAEAHAAVERLTNVAKEHALKVVETSSVMLDRIEDQVHGMGWPEIDARGAAIQRELRHMQEPLAQVASLHLVRPDGSLSLISIAYPTPAVNLASRGYFRELAAGAPGPVFGEPQRGATSGIVAFTMSRRRTAADGSFNGLGIVSLLPSYFQQYWRGMAEDDHFAFGLMRADGLTLARHPPAPDGEPAPATPPPAPLSRASAHVAVLEQGQGPDGAPWLTGFRQVGNQPLYVFVALPMAAIWNTWLNHQAWNAGLSLAAMLALGLASLMALRRWRAEQLARAELQAAADELRAEIERREQAEAGLRQAQRLEALGRLTGGVAHDFNNLLTAILGTVTLLERHLGTAVDEKARRLLAAARDAVSRGARLNAGLLAFARRQPLRPTSLDANALLRGFTPLVQQALGEMTELTLDLAATLPACRADAGQLEAAVLNLAINARDAMPRGGTVRLSTRACQLDEAALAGNPEARPGSFCAIALADSGEGMPEEVLDRAFEPFFTTKPMGKGTGLGLSQVFGFARQLGGHVTITSQAGRGTTVTLYLPVEAGAARPEPEREEVEVPGVVAMRHGSILLAEDDARVREVTAEMLRDAGFRVLAAEDGRDALALLRRGEPVDLVFSDVVMPGGISGFELAEEARRIRPGLAVLLTSGFAGAVSEPLDQDFEVLPKPYDRALLLQRIAALLDQPSPLIRQRQL